MFDPSTLFSGLGYGNTPRIAQAGYRGLGVEALRDKQTCSHQTAAPDSLTAMQHDIRAGCKFVIKFLQGFCKPGFGIGNLTVGNRKRSIATISAPSSSGR